ncbi:4Fe-4S dicluster domain-containing protein [Candidatus Harpocratesius sp.]
MTLVIDYNLREKFLRFNVSLNSCYQCATCSGICPVARITDGKFNPRKIIEAALLGLKEQLIELQQPNVWYCLTCQKCVESCPQKVELVEIFDVIKNTIVRNGKIPEAYNSQAKTIFQTGVALPFSDAILKRRKKLGLEKYKTADINEIQTLLTNIGFKKLIRFEDIDSDMSKENEEGDK